MNEIKIHDIKPLVNIEDYSFYIYYGLIVGGIILLLVSIYFIYKFIKRKNNNTRMEYFKVLKKIDFTNSKQTAYDITKYGYLLAQTSREKQLLNDLVAQLEIYKYQKSVPIISDEVTVMYDNFIDSLEV